MPPASSARGRSWRPRPPQRRGWRATWSAASAFASLCGWPPGSIGPTSRSRSLAPPDTRSARSCIEALRAEGALPAIVYAGTRAGAEELADHVTEELGEEAVPYHAGLDRGTRADRPASLPGRRDRGWWWPPTPSGWGWTSPTCGRSCTPRSHRRSRPTTRRRGARAATARRLARSSSRRIATRPCTCTSSSATSWTSARRSGWSSSSRGWPRAGGYSLDAATVCRELRVSQDSVRALIGHLARAGVLEPSPAPPDRLAGRLRSRYDRRAAGLWRASAAEGVRTRWRQYREIWAYVESCACRRRALLRHFGDRARPGAVGPLL